MGSIRKIKAGLVKIDIEQYIGETGNIFFDIENGSLRLSDGITPGGIELATSGGGPGTDTDMVYTTRVDFVGEDIIYRAEADPGTLDSESFWRIKRITISNDGDMIEEWADGDASFNNSWTDRLTLNYS